MRGRMILIIEAGVKVIIRCCITPSLIRLTSDI
nr:MAG TPA: hypothetical protein [Caudoviricetes sp.]